MLQDALNKVGIGAIALLALLLTSSIPTPDAALQVANNKLVLTYYFYWYDYATGLHMDNCGNSLALRPVNLSSVSYYSVAWHKKEFTDMMAAGVDVVLPVYWGYESGPWSTDGLSYISSALGELGSTSRQQLKIGMNLDATIVLGKDLTSQAGKEWFYSNFKDFFTRIPKEQWALVDGRPLAMIYSPAVYDLNTGIPYPTKWNQSTFDYVYQAFQKDFGVRPYIIRELAWDQRPQLANGTVRFTYAPLSTDGTFRWGAALNGPSYGTDVVSVGPGYDERTLLCQKGRTDAYKDRANGLFYEESFSSALRTDSRFLAIETWNEYHEATAVSNTIEYGRYYIDLTRIYTNLFKNGIRAVPPATGGAAFSHRVSASFDPAYSQSGLSLVNVGDGLYEFVKTANGYALKTEANPVGGRYLYFNVNDGFAFLNDVPTQITVEYYDLGSTQFFLQYDSWGNNTRDTSLAAVYKPLDPFNPSNPGFTVSRLNTGSIHNATFSLKDARFANVENGGSDFRLGTFADDIYVRRVFVEKLMSGVLLSINATEPYVWLNIDNITYSANRYGLTWSWVPQGQHVLQAISPMTIQTGSRDVFVQWGDGRNSSQRIINVQVDTKVTVVYKRQYSVVFVAYPPSAGTVSPMGERWYDSNSSLAISAIPSDGYRFASWNSSNPSISIANPRSASTSATMGGPGNVTASFAAIRTTTTTSTTSTSSPTQSTTSTTTTPTTSTSTTQSSEISTSISSSSIVATTKTNSNFSNSVATVVVPSQNYSSYIGIGMAAVVVAVVAAFALKRRARH